MPHTLVTFHAHPDDEALATAGVMAQAAARGDRVVLVVATKGEHAGYGHELLDADESMADRRVAETQRAAEIIGVGRVEFLGYVDSGMVGTPQNDATGSFWSADVEEAAQRLAAILVAEDADALTVYDENGVYGHPDHIQVHRVGVRAGELAGTPRVFEQTINRDYVVRVMKAHAGSALPEGVQQSDLPDPDSFDLGVPESDITTTIDVREFIDTKRAAMAAHASQISESSWFLQLPPDIFTETFGYEWFIRRGAAPGTRETSLFDH
jgi:LmbE family N-acetylglucosaminyl deacetylase